MILLLVPWHWSLASLSLSLPVFLCISLLFSLSLCHIFWLKKEIINYHPYSTVPLLHSALRNYCAMFPSCPKLKVCLYALVALQAILLFQSNLSNLSTYTSSWLFRNSEQVEDAVDTRRSLQISLIGDSGKFHTLWFNLVCPHVPWRKRKRLVHKLILLLQGEWLFLLRWVLFLI